MEQIEGEYFCDYWKMYPERNPSLEKRLGLSEGTFDNTLDEFNSLTEQAECVVREATSTRDIRNINEKIYNECDIFRWIRTICSN